MRPTLKPTRRLSTISAVVGVVLLGLAVGAYATVRARSGPDFTSSLVALHSEKCLTPAGAHFNGVDLKQQACSGTDAQNFAFTKVNGDAYQVRNMATGTCVGVRDVVAVFLFLGANWARYIGIGLGVLNVVFGLYSLVIGSPTGSIGVVLNGVVLALLLRRETADWCYRY